MGNINKGTIAGIEGNTARVVPSDAGAKPTAKIVIPWHLRGDTGKLTKGTAVVYVEFDDSTGLLLGRADGEWGEYLPRLTAGTITAAVPDGDVTAAGISLKKHAHTGVHGETSGPHYRRDHMATMAKWGSKTWAVSTKKVVALEGLSFSYSQVADNNTSTEEKKTTNERGTDLFPLSFTTVLLSGAGVDVRIEIERGMALGGKKLGPKLQLRKVSVSNVKIDDMGRMRLATLSFEFKEYDPDTTSVKVSTSALNVKTSTSAKSTKKTENKQVAKAEKKTIKVGARVRPTGQKYATGQKIPGWVKERSHVVSQIKESQNKVLLGHPDGINSWVYLSEVTLV